MQDLRLALRTIRRHRWFSAAIVTTLALGIGINTTVFTLVDAVLFRSLPFPNGDRLVTLASVRPAEDSGLENVSHADLQDFRAQTRSFEAIEAVSISQATISEPTVPAGRYWTAHATTGIFRAAGTAPLAGRGFTPADGVPGAPTVVVISFDVWRTRYQQSPDVIGRAVRIDEQPATIVGVMPEGFHFPNREDVWVALVRTGDAASARDQRDLLGIGLLRPGISLAAASKDVDGVAARLARAYPETNAGVTAQAATFNDRFNGREIRIVFLLMLAAVGFVLLIACANVANMMLSRALGRRREMAIRASLGASRWRLIRQVLVECVLLSLTGGAVGLALAALGVRAFDAAVQNVGKPSWMAFSLDHTVLAYCAAICVLSALAFGLAPAFRSSRVDLTTTMKQGGRGGSGVVSRLAAPLVVLQFTLSVALLTAAGLLMRSFVAGQTVNGFVPRSEILTGRLTLPQARYPDRESVARFFDDAIARLRTIPGAIGAAAVSTLPGLGVEYRRIERAGALVDNPKDRPSVAVVRASAGYFALVNLPLMQGRDFDGEDGTDGHEVAVVSRLFAETYWPGENPIGARFRLNDEHPGPWLQVIGIAADLVQTGNRAASEPVVFVPARQLETRSAMLAVRTRGDAARLGTELRRAIQGLDADLALERVETVESQVRRQRWAYRVFGTLFGLVALTALVMAAIGLYAVVAETTGRRTREIGIRVALGATPARILRTILARGLWPLALGLAFGAALSFFTTGLMRPLLFGVLPADPLVFGTSAATLFGVGMIACWLPAWRAAVMPPTQALGQEDGV